MFPFGPAACCCDPQLLFRFTLIDILLKKETRKILTDDLISFIALDAFGPGVPTGNLSPRIQHENRVVLDPIEDYPIFFFATPEGLLCKTAPKVVALDIPARRGCDRHAQDGSEDQNNF